MNTLYIDLETYSPVDIKRGVYRYAEQAEILLVAYAVNDGPVSVWDATGDRFDINEHKELCDYSLYEDTVVCAHNSNFDRVVVEACLKALHQPIYIFRQLAASPWRDTMVRARAHGLPGGLSQLSDIYKLADDKAKIKEGRKSIQLFCKPQRDGSRATRKTHPKEWKQFVEYASKDIESMRELDKKIPKWNDTDDEYSTWQLDQRINDRGFAVDIDLAESAIEALEIEKKRRDRQCTELTDGDVSAATKRDQLLKHLLKIHGVDLPDMQASTLRRRLEDPDLPQPVRDLLALRLQSAGTATKKYQALIGSVSSDGRLRGTLQFCGAPRTARWSGRIFQPQNLPRPQHSADDVDTGIEAIKLGASDLLYESVSAIASSAIRGAIVAPPKKKLVISDLSSIEGRVLAWLAGEQWKLDAYRDYDAGIGYDMYVLTYGKTFNVAPATVTKEQRQLGKVLELALGYGGGVGAFVTFANGFNIDLQELADNVRPVLPSRTIDDATRYWHVCVTERKTLGLPEDVFVACDSIKRLWREANSYIVDFWRGLENGAREVLNHPGTIAIRDQYRVDKKGTWMRIKLPSGRYLCYAGAHYDDKIKYLGLNTYTRRWGKLSTYGGKLAENVTQAASRDILAYGMEEAETAGYEVVLSVHDELITETPDTPEFTHTQLSQIMATAPAWADGLPLAAAGFETNRYRKG